MAFRSVARVGEIPEGRGLCVEIDGIDVGLFRAEGRIWAMENRCPHAGIPLSEGRLEGAVVTCRAHGWDYDGATEVAFDTSELAVLTEEMRNAGFTRREIEQVMGRNVARILLALLPPGSDG